MKQVADFIGHYDMGVYSNVLDLGCGNGRYAMIYARKNLSVTAVDNSELSTSYLLNKSNSLRLRINVIFDDVSKLDFDKLGYFDIMHCTNVLHFIDKNKSHEVINKIKSHTKSGGLNIITVFAKTGELKVDNPFNEEELKKFYSNWKIIEFSKFSCETMEKHANGKIKMHDVLFIVAKK